MHFYVAKLLNFGETSRSAAKASLWFSLDESSKRVLEEILNKARVVERYQRFIDNLLSRCFDFLYARIKFCMLLIGSMFTLCITWPFEFCVLAAFFLIGLME